MNPGFTSLALDCATESERACRGDNENAEQRQRLPAGFLPARDRKSLFSRAKILSRGRLRVRKICASDPNLIDAQSRPEQKQNIDDGDGEQ